MEKMFSQFSTKKLKYTKVLSLAFFLFVILSFFSNYESHAARQWVKMTSGTNNYLMGVWGSSASNIFAVGGGDWTGHGYESLILHYDGNQWSKMSIDTEGWLQDVWGSSENDVFAVGDTILHYDGNQWSEMSNSASGILYDVWGSSKRDVFAVGLYGTILRYDGNQWIQVTTSTEYSVHSVWGSSASDVFFVGCDDPGFRFSFIAHYDGSPSIPVSIVDISRLMGVWGSSGSNVFAVGDRGRIFHYNGSIWSEMSNPSISNALRAIWGSSGNDVFAVGDNGTILHYDGNQWSQMNSGTSETLYDVWGVSGSDVFVVGAGGTILRYTDIKPPTATTSAASNITATGAALNGIINPNGLSTTYNFEYGATTTYGATTDIVSGGSGSSDQSVSANLTGLTPGSVYHYRLVTTNSAGTTRGSDQSFTTDAILSIIKTGNGSGTITSAPSGLSCGSGCSVSYVVGTLVTLIATPDSSSTFTGWSGGGCSGTGQCTVTMDAPKSVTATFSLNTYVVTLPPIANGTISCDPITVNYGSNTTCIITPSTGYHLVTLTDNGADVTYAMSGNTYSIYYVVSDHTINPTFAINTYAITTSAGENGSIAPSSTVDHGSSATVAITPNANYHVTDVLVDGVSVGAVASYNFQNVIASHTISATFAINTYTLAIIKAGTGSGIVTGAPGGINCGNACWASYVVEPEASVTLTAIPAFGSTFTGWSGGGCAGTGNCSLIVNDNIQITALFSNPWGDVNNDDNIDLADAILSLQILSNIDTTGKTVTLAADANNDGKIGMTEVIYILQKVAGLR